MEESFEDAGVRAVSTFCEIDGITGVRVCVRVRVRVRVRVC